MGVTYQEIVAWTDPKYLIDYYRHPDGTVRMFRRSDKAYLGLNTDKRFEIYLELWDFSNAQPLPPELMEKIKEAEAG